MASAINSAARSVVSATVSGSTVSLSSVGTGAGTDYAVSVAVADTQTAAYPTVFPSPSFAADVSNMTGGSAAVFSGSTGAISLAGTEAGPLTAQTVPGSAVLTVSGSYVQQQQTVCVTVPTGYENYTYQSCSAQNVNSTLSVTIHGFTAKVSYGSAYSAGSIAAALASSFNVSGSPVTAVSSGSMVTVTAVASGPGSDYPILVSAVGGYTISSSSATLTGVINPTSFYDAGTATATLTNSSVSPAVTYTATVNWGRGDTSATLAGKLSTAINNSAGSIVTATASGSSINLVSSATGLGANYPLSVSIADTQTAAYPTLFPRPSFSATVSSMSGGGAPDANYGFIYSYWVPTGGYAPNGNILAHVDSVMGDWLFTYDMVDRLTMAAAGSKAPTQYAGNYGCWTYDSYGNRTLEAFSSASCGGNPTPQALNTYNAANNRIVYSTASPATVPGANAFGYDASGNTLYDGNNEYWYDAEGQLCAVQSQRSAGAPVIQYVYDAEGARIAKGTLDGDGQRNRHQPALLLGCSAELLHWPSLLQRGHHERGRRPDHR
jgi:YD repeat-containing protein